MTSSLMLTATLQRGVRYMQLSSKTEKEKGKGKVR